MSGQDASAIHDGESGTTSDLSPSSSQQTATTSNAPWLNQDKHHARSKLGGSARNGKSGYHYNYQREGLNGHLRDRGIGRGRNGQSPRYHSYLDRQFVTPSPSTISSSSYSVLPCLNQLDLQTPQAFAVVVGIMILSLAGVKSYQHITRELKRRKRALESEKAAEELLRLNVKHGVVDPDGTLRHPPSKPLSNQTCTRGVSSSIKGKGTESERRRRRVDAAATESSHLEPAPPSASQTDTQTDDDLATSVPSTPNKAAKTEAKKAKKKIKRAARLEKRMNSLDADVEVDDLEHEERESSAEYPGTLEQTVSKQMTDQVESSLEQVLEDIPKVETPEQVTLDDLTDTDKGTDGAATGQISSDVSTPTLEPTSVEEGCTPLIASPVGSGSGLGLEIRPPATYEGLSDSANSLRSGTSGGGGGNFLSLSGKDVTQRLLDDVKLGLTNGAHTTPPHVKKKRKSKSSSSTNAPKRLVPGAENWAQEHKEEEERLAREDLVNQINEAKAATVSAEERAHKMEKDCESLTGRLHKLEDKMSEMTSIQQDLREREKIANRERDEAVRRANDAQSVVQNYRKLETTLKHDLVKARKDREKSWQETQRVEAAVSLVF